MALQKKMDQIHYLQYDK